VAAAVALAMMVASLLMGPGRAGKGMFAAMTWLAWVFCLVEGVRNAADCLSEEKREGTLGLLFLTDLRGYDVVLGKFAAASVGAVFSLLAAFPVLGLALIQGGVTFGEFARMGLALGNTLFFTVAASLFVSAVSRVERRAWLGAFLLSGAFVLVGPLANALPAGSGRTWGLLSPWVNFTSAFEAAYAPAPSRYWLCCLSVHALGWLWLALAAALLPRTWQEDGGRPLPQGLPPFSGAVGPQQAGQTELRSMNPVLWLSLRESGRARVAWVVALAAAGLGLLISLALLSEPGSLFGLLACAFPVHLALTLCVAWEACHVFGGMRRSGFLELLLSTPLPLFLIVQGGHSALVRRFLRPVVILAAAELIVLGLMAGMLAGGGARGGSGLLVGAVLLVVGGGGLWLLDMMAVARVGMWFSLVHPKAGQAWARTVWWVLVAPALALVPSAAFCCGVAAPFLLLAKDLLFIQWANGNLRARLREEAARPVGLHSA